MGNGKTYSFLMHGVGCTRKHCYSKSQAGYKIDVALGNGKTYSFLMHGVGCSRKHCYGKSKAGYKIDIALGNDKAFQWMGLSECLKLYLNRK